MKFFKTIAAWCFAPPSSDQQLANEVRQAAEAYNTALRKATRAGLTAWVTVESRFGKDHNYNSTIGNIDITRDLGSTRL